MGGFATPASALGFATPASIVAVFISAKWLLQGVLLLYA